MSLTRPQVTPTRLAYSEWVMSSLRAAGLVPRRIFQMHLTVFSHVRGLAVSLEPEAVAEQETGLTSSEFVDSRDAAFTELIYVRGVPDVPGAGRRRRFDLDLDERFEFGLRHLLAGLAGLPVEER